MGNVWPGLDDQLAAAFEAVGAGRNINVSNNVRARRATYYHRLVMTSAITSLTVFANAQNTTAGTTNLPQPGFLPTQQPMWLTGVTIQAQPGCLTVNGNGKGAGGQMIDTTVTDPVTVAEEVRAIFQSGFFNLKIGDFVVIDGQGLDTVPAAGGFYAGAAFGTGGFALPFTNGDPSADNMYKVQPWYPILPQKQIVGTLSWNAANTLTANCVLKVTLHGIQVTPSNL